MKQQNSFQKQNWFPDLSIEYFQGKNSGLSQSLYGIQVGVAIPLFFNGNINKQKVARLEMESWEQQKESETEKINRYIEQKQSELLKYQEAIGYYNETGKHLASEIIKVADMSYKHGEIDFFQYIQSLDNATQIEIEFLNNVLLYNNAKIDLQYLNY
jgi:cobalt-zinc-cadmium resistance protein CzcA